MIASLLAGKVISTRGFAQCSLGETGYNLVLTGGNNDEESSWEIYPAPEIGPSAQACGSFAPGQYPLCLNNNTNYTFTAYDDYGDGWNGGTVTISQSGANCVILPPTLPTNHLSGDMNWNCISSDTELSFSWMAGPVATCENPPANDECNNALFLTHTANAVLTSATAAHSSQSLEAITCDTYTSSEPVRDVWFCFSATDTLAYILVSDSANPNLAAFDAVIELFDGCNGNSMDCEDISSPEILGASGLTPGHTYCFRVYPYSDLENDLDFGVAVYGSSGGGTSGVDNLHLDVSVPGAAQFLVFDLTGRVVYHSALYSNSTGGYDVLPDTEMLPQGLYYICFLHHDKASIVQKIMINK